jgi:hypothetical protein
MEYNRRGRIFPAIFAGLILLLIGSSICTHLFFPFSHYGYYPWHPFFPFGGFFIFRSLLFVGLIFFIGRRFFWGRRWECAGRGHHMRFSGPPYGCGGGPVDEREASSRWGRNQFREYRHGKAPFEKLGSRASDDFIELASGFGTVEKKVTSKNFQGGDVTTINGRLVLDLREADITGSIRLKVTQVRGITSIVVPREWNVKPGEGTVFAVYQDSQASAASINPDKVLIIDGTCVMGEIEVRTS